jgi:hypothetical protein
MATESATGKSWNSGSRFVWHFRINENEGIGTSTLLIQVENNRRKNSVLSNEIDINKYISIRKILGQNIFG